MRRRTVTAGIAWATPAILIASAAPAMAASAPGVVLHATGIACKLPGGSCESQTGVRKGYVIRLAVTLTAPNPVTVTFPDTIKVTLNGVTDDWRVAPRTLRITGSGVVDVSIEGQPSSSNAALSGVLTYNTDAGTSGSVPFSAASTPPCVDCRPEGA